MKPNPRPAAHTIAAIATPPGEGGIAIIRMSGPGSRAVAAKVFRPATAPLAFEPRKAVFGAIIGADNTPVDTGFLTYFAAPKSYTGEDVIELSCHGGRYITGKILTRLLECGAIPAEPGEFTRRAFLNGRMDLVQAEAVAALIRADTEKAQQAAKFELDGRLSERYAALHEKTKELVALTESNIEFAEEDGIFLDVPKMVTELNGLIREIHGMADSYEEGRRLTEGLRVAIAGPPNAGKSSLFNALVERERVIVDPHPGTTRDLVEECVSLLGRKVVLTDTAGIRSGAKRVEARGITLARKAASEADLALIVFDASVLADKAALASFTGLACRKRIFVLNKCDRKIRFKADLPGPVFQVSAKTLHGLSDLKKAILTSTGPIPSEGEALIITSLRQRKCLEKAGQSIEAALRLAKKRPLREELLALELQEALQALESVTGRVTDDDILNRIFSRFCIGK